MSALIPIYLPRYIRITRKLLKDTLASRRLRAANSHSNMYLGKYVASRIWKVGTFLSRQLRGSFFYPP